jgi:hypothetical protein
MSRSANEDRLAQGPREAPEPETAEERSKRMGWGTAAGGAAAGGAALAKLGFLSKFVIWIVAWHGAINVWRIGGWVAIVAVAAVVVTYLAIRWRRNA